MKSTLFAYLVCVGMLACSGTVVSKSKSPKSEAGQENTSEVVADAQLCSKKINAIANRPDCEGNMCIVVLGNMRVWLTKCSTPGSKGPHIETGQAFLSKVEGRIRDIKQIAVLARLGQTCKKMKDEFKPENAQDTIERLIVHFETAHPLGPVAENGQDLNAAKVEAISFCKPVLKDAVDVVVLEKADQLGKRSIVDNPKKWIEHYSYLSELGLRLGELDADTLTYRSTKGLYEIIKRLSETNEKLIRVTTQNRISLSHRRLKTGAGKCDLLTEKIVHCRQKIESHQAKGNAKKVVAYRLKLEKSEKAVIKLKTEMDHFVGTRTLPEETPKELLAPLEEGSCLTATR